MAEQRVYRQFAHRLRVQRGPGRPDLVSERPHRRDAAGNPVYTDSDEAPTLVTFDEHCQVDIPFLLRTGAVAEYQPPKATAEKGVRGG